MQGKIIGGLSGSGRGNMEGIGGLDSGKVINDINVNDIAPANTSAKYDEGKVEAAVMLQALTEMRQADPSKKKDGDKELSDRDKVAAIIADRINNTPFYQEAFGIGGDTGRKVVGFQEVSDPDQLPSELKGLIPDDAIVPVIANSKTGSIGPMTEKASADPDDKVQMITMSQLAEMAQE